MKERKELSDQPPLSLLPPLSPPFIGEVGEEVLFISLGGFIFTETPLGTTNGLLGGFVFIKISLKATNDP